MLSRTLQEGSGETREETCGCAQIPVFHGWLSGVVFGSGNACETALTDRLPDFIRHYEKPKSRKSITHENYTIEDFLHGLRVTRSIGEYEEKIVGPESAILQFRQQLPILKSVNARFESSLFDIRRLVQADLFDSELDAAQELSKNKFIRAARALAGVVLEKHLGQVCENHNVKVAKKDPTISELNDALMKSQAIDLPQWRFVRLAVISGHPRDACLVSCASLASIKNERIANGQSLSSASWI